MLNILYVNLLPTWVIDLLGSRKIKLINMGVFKSARQNKCNITVNGVKDMSFPDILSYLL